MTGARSAVASLSITMLGASAALGVGLTSGSAHAVAPAGCQRAGDAVTCTYTKPGIAHAFGVPAGVTSAQFELRGARGGAHLAGDGGLGGIVRATLPLTPGTTLTLLVGGGGSHTATASGGSGGAFGGGTGGFGLSSGGGGGGGGTFVLAGGSDPTTIEPLLAAGGGGGGSDGRGGDGAGGPGIEANGTGGGGDEPGAGGTQTTGGMGGTGADAGKRGLGGTGTVSLGTRGGGGGGGGYYGGGTGGPSSGGGGGSSHAHNTASGVSYDVTERSDPQDGRVTITYHDPLGAATVTD